MIQTLSRHQNWAKASLWLAIVTMILLFRAYQPTQVMFWALVNIPMYLFHQSEEHLWPGGFKEYMNQIVYGLPDGQEKLTDVKVFGLTSSLCGWLSLCSDYCHCSILVLGY